MANNDINENISGGEDIKIRTLLLGMAVLIAATAFVSCIKLWECDSCGKIWAGKAYYGITTMETPCEKCAERYWGMFPYEQFTKKDDMGII